jgi:hypothetical protein
MYKRQKLSKISFPCAPFDFSNKFTRVAGVPKSKYSVSSLPSERFEPKMLNFSFSEKCYLLHLKVRLTLFPKSLVNVTVFSMVHLQFHQTTKSARI